MTQNYSPSCSENKWLYHHFSFIFLDLLFSLFYWRNLPFLSLPLFGSVCSHSHEVPSKQALCRCIDPCIMTSIAWKHRCALNDMLSFWVCWFTVRVIHSCCFSWPWDTQILLRRLSTGLLLCLNLFICHPPMHWEIRDRGGGGFRRTTAGIFQPNGYVFT